MRSRTLLCAGALFASVTLLMGDGGDCSGDPPSAEQRDRQATEQLAQQGIVQVGWPGITNFTEKRLLKMLYELRDNANLVTYSYYLDLEGRRHKLCPTTSVGYGIPYATQYTNGLKPAGDSYHSLVAINNPEPNGLFPPASAEGTWVMCLAPDGKSLSPLYVEPRVIVSQFAMSTAD
jgi:hypothetical protein